MHHKSKIFLSALVLTAAALKCQSVKSNYVYPPPNKA